MKYKPLSFLLVSALTAVSLAGCGSSGEDQGGAAPENAVSSSVQEISVSSESVSSASEAPETDDAAAAWTFSVTETETASETEEADPAEAEDAARQADEAAMYAAYLAKLNEYRELILRYDWQMSDGEFHYPPGSAPAALRPVALADIWGDEDPELLFINVPETADYNGIADLHIWGWKEGALRELCSFPNWDAAVASGTHFALLQIRGEKTLYAYSYIGDETGYYTWYRFGGEETLAAEKIATAEVDWAGYEERPDVYTVNGQDTDQAAYEAHCTGFLEAAERTVLYSASESGDSILAALFQKEMISMSLDDALARLTSLSSAAGGTETGTVSTEGLLFPDSDARNLTEGDIAGFSDTQIQQAINEIFAKHGYSFKDPEIYAYFSSFSWYHPTSSDMEAVSARFNSYETANVRFLSDHR